MNRFLSQLEPGDLRTVANVESIVSLVRSQAAFDELFELMFYADRKVRMRAADATEKITSAKPDFLAKHTEDLVQLLLTAKDKEFKWHLAQLVSRVTLKPNQLHMVWLQLIAWLSSSEESRIVRVFSLQTLYELLPLMKSRQDEFRVAIDHAYKEKIPSINARLRKLKLV